MTTTKRRPGRPKKRETLERELAKAQQELERLKASPPTPAASEEQLRSSEDHSPPQRITAADTDPFAEEVLPPPAARGAASRPAEPAAAPADPAAAPSGEVEKTEQTPSSALGQVVPLDDGAGPVDGAELEPDDGKAPLGEERARALFNQAVAVYNAMGARSFALTFSRKNLEMIPTNDARELFAQLELVAQVSDQDRELLEEPIVTRLAQLRVSKHSDLWLTLLFVFGIKARFISQASKEAVYKHQGRAV